MKKWMVIVVILGTFIQAYSAERINKLLGHLKLDVKYEDEKKSIEEIEKPKEQGLLEKLNSLKPEQAIDYIIKNCRQLISVLDVKNLLKLTLLSENKLALIYDRGTRIKILDLEINKFIFDLDAVQYDTVSSICLLSESKLAVASHYSGEIKIWDLKTKKCVDVLQERTSGVTSICLLPDNKLASASYENGQIRIWDLSTNKCIGALEGHRSKVSSMCILPGNKLASASDDQTIRIWDLYANKCINILDKITPVHSIVSLPENKLAISQFNSLIKIWDLEANKEIVNLENDYGAISVCSLTGNKLAAMSKKMIKIWDLETNKYTNILDGNTELKSMCLLPGNKLAVGYVIGIIKILDLNMILQINEYLRTINLLKIPISKLNELAHSIGNEFLSSLYIAQLKEHLIKNQKYLPFDLVFQQKPEFLDIKDIKDLFGIYYRSVCSSPSKAHIAVNVDSVINMIKKKKSIFDKKEVQEFLSKIYEREKDEISKGNYTFVHGRKKTLRFAGEIYKQLWNIAKNDNVKNDFEFLRFEQQEKWPSIRRDYLFMNYALFANCHEHTLASTVSQYWIEDISIYDPPFNNEKLFELFNMKKYYSKYKKELDELEKLHNEATPYGDIILVTIPASKIDLVRPVAPGGKVIEVYIDGKEVESIKIIYDTLKTKPVLVTDKFRNNISNTIEFSIPMEKTNALNPKSGIKYYSFYFMHDTKQAEYNKLRDEIFSRIKKEYLEEKNSFEKAKTSKLTSRL